MFGDVGRGEAWRREKLGTWGCEIGDAGTSAMLEKRILFSYSLFLPSSVPRIKIFFSSSVELIIE